MLKLQQSAELFDRDIKTIGKHIANVFNEQELDAYPVVANFATTASDGTCYQLIYKKMRGDSLKM